MNRAQRRREARKQDPLATADRPFRLEYRFSEPGGLLRSEHAATFAGVITTEHEADMLRDALSMLIEKMYAGTPGDVFPRLFAAVLCDVLNPAGRYVRGQIAYGLMEGLGLLVQQTETEQCDPCGVYRDQVNDDPEHREDCNPEVRKWITEVGILVDAVHKYAGLRGIGGGDQGEGGQDGSVQSVETEISEPDASEADEQSDFGTATESEAETAARTSGSQSSPASESTDES